MEIDQPATTFPRFSSFPLEIQRCVWDHAGLGALADDDPAICYCANVRDACGISSLTDLDNFPVKPGPIYLQRTWPGVRAACREARAAYDRAMLSVVNTTQEWRVELRDGSRIGRESVFMPERLFRPDVDILYVPEPEFGTFQRILLGVQRTIRNEKKAAMRAGLDPPEPPPEAKPAPFDLLAIKTLAIDLTMDHFAEGSGMAHPSFRLIARFPKLRLVSLVAEAPPNGFPGADNDIDGVMGFTLPGSQSWSSQPRVVYWPHKLEAVPSDGFVFPESNGTRGIYVEDIVDEMEAQMQLAFSIGSNVRDPETGEIHIRWNVSRLSPSLRSFDPPQDPIALNPPDDYMMTLDVFDMPSVSDVIY